MRTGEDKDRCIETILSSGNSTVQMSSYYSCREAPLTGLSTKVSDSTNAGGRASRKEYGCTRIRERVPDLPAKIGASKE